MAAPQRLLFLWYVSVSSTHNPPLFEHCLKSMCFTPIVWVKCNSQSHNTGRKPSRDRKLVIGWGVKGFCLLPTHTLLIETCDLIALACSLHDSILGYLSIYRCSPIRARSHQDGGVKLRGTEFLYSIEEWEVVESLLHHKHKQCMQCVAVEMERYVSLPQRCLFVWLKRDFQAKLQPIGTCILYCIYLY